MVTPGPFATQTKWLPSTISVTSQTATGSFGCLIRVFDPTFSGPSSRRSTVLIDAVHSGHRSTSLNTS